MEEKVVEILSEYELIDEMVKFIQSLPDELINRKKHAVGAIRIL